MKSKKFLYSLTSIVLSSFLVSVFIVFAADPASPFTPAENVQDPGDPLSSWGGCGPSDSNCYVTFAMPSSATPTVDSDGEIAYDTTVTDFSTGVIRFYGTEEQGILAMPIGEFTAPTDGQLVAYNATNDEFELISPTGVTPDSLDYDDFEDTMDFDANLILNQGSNTLSQTFTGTTGTGYSYAANSLTSGRALSIASSSLTFGTLVNLSSTSTGAISNAQKVLNVSTSGANVNASQTTFGGYFSNTHTGSGFTQNRAIYATSSGGSVNTAVYGVASGGTTAVGLYGSASGATNNYAAHIDGILALGSGSSFLIESFSDLTLSLGAGTPPSVIGTLLFGSGAGSSATNAQNSNFLGTNAGYGATNAADSNFLGDSAGYGATGALQSNFFGIQAGYNASAADRSNFFGPSAGYTATSAEYSNFFGSTAGSGATNSSYSNFIGYRAGKDATDAPYSVFIGSSAGLQATNSIFGVYLGSEAGGYAANAPNSVFVGAGAGYAPWGSNASDSVFLGYSAGSSLTQISNASNSIFIGKNAGLSDTVDNTTGGYSILFGPDTDTGNFSNSIAMGRGATNTASNQLIIGSSTANSYIDSVFFGSGVTSASPVDYAINGSGASGTNIGGGDVTIAGGKATGNAAGGSILFQTSDAGASGVTLRNLSTKMTILASGFVGISNTNPGVALHVGSASTTDATTLLRLEDANSTCNFTADAGAPTCGSDRNLKKDIEELNGEEILEKLTSLDTVSYRWKTEDEDSELQYGFIAQNVQESFPNLVKSGTWIDGSQKLFLSMGGMMPYAVASIKELNLKLIDIQDFDDEDSSFGRKLRDWFGSSSNGIKSLFVKDTICIGETCINEDQLKVLIQNAGVNTENNNAEENPSVSEEEIIPTENIEENADLPAQTEEVEDVIIEELEEVVTEETVDLPTETGENTENVVEPEIIN